MWKDTAKVSTKLYDNYVQDGRFVSVFPGQVPQFHI